MLISIVLCSIIYTTQNTPLRVGAVPSFGNDTDKPPTPKAFCLMEEWKDIIGYEGLYKVNSLGQVMTCRKGRLLSNYNGTLGYVLVKVSKNGVPKNLLVHRLIALYFIPSDDPANKTEVHHIDHNPANCTIENLMWVTPGQNQKYCNQAGRRRHTRHMLGRGGALHPLSIPVLRISERGAEKRFTCAAEAAVSSGADQSAIHKACKGILKQHKGYKWKYTT